MGRRKGKRRIVGEKFDPITQRWADNFNSNIESKIFSSERSWPLSYVEKHNLYQDAPIILIAAGPSLDKNIHKIIEHQDKAVIICADVILYKLLEHNIKPDFVVSVDPSDSIARFWEKLETEGLSFICPITTSPVSLKKWKGNLFFFNQVDVKHSKKGKALKKITKNTSGFGNLVNRYFVGATMYQIACMFQPSTIILMGYDFAYTDGKAYCDGFLELKLYDDNNVGLDVLYKREIVPELLVEVDGEQIGIPNIFNLYKKTLLEIISKGFVHVVNSTEGGMLTELMRMPIEHSLIEYCSSIVEKKELKHEVLGTPKRKRKRRKK